MHFIHLQTKQQLFPFPVRLHFTRVMSTHLVILVHRGDFTKVRCFNWLFQNEQLPVTERLLRLNQFLCHVKYFNCNASKAESRWIIVCMIKENISAADDKPSTFSNKDEYCQWMSLMYHYCIYKSFII